MGAAVERDEVTSVLFRPVGRAELALIAATDFRAFPPRLPMQPIFYPVLQEAYAVQIARDWNTKDEASGYAGYVTRFHVRRAFLARYDIRTVGSSAHQEYWIPAEELGAFNQAIEGRIEVIATFEGERPRKAWRELNRRVEKVLREVWQPLGPDIPADEFDSYAPHLTGLLLRGATDDELRRALDAMDTDVLGSRDGVPNVPDVWARVLTALREAANDARGAT